MKEVKKELKYDNHRINEMVERVKYIKLKKADDQKLNETHSISDINKMIGQIDISHGKDNEHIPTDFSRVMFKAANLTKQDYSKGDTIVFSEEVYNIGEGYDPTYGLFVTPLAGTYYFTVQLYIAKQNTTDVGIFVDEDCVAFARLTQRHASCGNLAVVVTLKLGDVVYLKQLSETWKNVYPTVDADFKTEFSSFSGVFIR